MIDIVNNANKLSLAVQTITGLVGLYGLTIPLASQDIILREVLGLEMAVQIIEYVFYIGFLSIFSLSSLTITRYYDWFISTPIMLFTTSLYFFYVNFIEGSTYLNKRVRLVDFLKANSKQIGAIILFNFIMLLVGFLAELGYMDRSIAFVLGMGALFGSFGIIYTNYAKHSQKTQNIFWIMFGLWAMYGISFLLNPIAKNIGYTILDIFAKNFFGIFLYIMINKKAI